jgi:hypothetical protein
MAPKILGETITALKKTLKTRSYKEAPSIYELLEKV